MAYEPIHASRRAKAKAVAQARRFGLELAMAFSAAVFLLLHFARA